MRAIGNGIGIPFRRNTGQGVIWPPDLKSALVCWYSPRKQKLTEYDVIEAYVEDFTNWNYFSSRGTATVSQHKFIITECVLNGLGIVEDTQEPYSNLTVRITGITDNQGVLITDYVNGQHQIINTITEDGIYTIEDRHHFIGFGCNFVGTCNITITQLPTSILKDFSGNGLDAYMYGFQGKLNSGMGVYQQDFSKLIISRVDKKQDPFSFTVSGSGGSYLAYMQLGNWNNKAFKILVNINAERDYLYLRFRNNTDAVITSVALKNGENIIPAQNIEGATKAVFEYSLKEGETITITQIPDYPNQLCYSGKEYCISFNQPILTDYTVIADRTWFDKQINHTFANNTYLDDAVNRGFLFEQIRSDTEVWATSFGTNNTVQMAPNGILYQTKNSYNGTPINSGNATYIDKIVIGCYLNKQQANPYYFYHGCHSDFLLFNRTLTQEEIDWVKNKIFQDTNN